MTLNNLMVRLQPWSFKECGVPLSVFYIQGPHQSQTRGDTIVSVANVCWYSFIKLSSYESALICIKVMSYKLKWDYTNIGAFHYSQVAKSILCLVSDWLLAQWIYKSACFSHVMGLVLSYRPFYFLSASWTLSW